MASLRGAAMKRHSLMILLCALLAPATTRAEDVTLYDNMTGFDPASYAFDQVYWYLYVGGGIVKQEVAQRFSTGDFPVTLSSVVLPLHGEGGNPWVGLYGDAAGKPDGLLGRLPGASGTMGHGSIGGQPIFGSVTYDGGGISLAPNTTYWVVLSEEGSRYAYCYAPCGGEIWWADRPDTTSPRALYFTVDGSVTYDWRSTGAGYVPLMRVIATTIALQPLADAGADGTAHPGSTVTLDGSGSSDPSGLSLTYSWEFVSVPQGSLATLSDPAALGPSFVIDMQGDYVVQLVVTNSQGAASQPATVTISTYDTAPVADPGPNQAIVEIGTTVFLDGSQSFDPDGDAITYSWTFASKPPTSAATLAGDTTSTPTFVADVQGTYVIQLVVSDPWAESTPQTVTVSFDNIKPVANAGTGQLAMVGELVTLDGSGSSDANFDPLTYQWSFATMPPESVTALADATSVQATFVPDQPGTYVVQLIVHDGFVSSDPSTVTIQGSCSITTAAACFEPCGCSDDTLLTLVSDEITLIDSFAPLAFKNSNLQNSLIHKLQAVMSAIQAEDFEGAASKLKNDVMGKTDGCAVSGEPDKNDWIMTCAAQQEVHANLVEIIGRITELTAD